ncbi:DUF3592 domain-containing protein [Paraburkholderia sp. Ac-20340]|uniref:DUF3592 domain-containing protein n=1 Tax=Paraburkholderia sp. Ac-20340 TaxID=2703888 RepID=UPI0032173284
MVIFNSSSCYVSLSCLFSLSEQLAFVNSSVVTQGTVVKLDYGERHPQISFVTKAGERVAFPGSFVSAKVGDNVRVRYNQNNPLVSAEIDSFYILWIEIIISAVFAIAFLCAGLTGQEFRSRYE